MGTLERQVKLSNQRLRTFPIYEEKVNGSSMLKLNARPFRGLEQMGLSTIELCAIYFTRTTLLAFGAGPMVDDMTLDSAPAVYSQAALRPTEDGPSARGREYGFEWNEGVSRVSSR